MTINLALQAAGIATSELTLLAIVYSFCIDVATTVAQVRFSRVLNLKRGGGFKIKAQL